MHMHVMGGRGISDILPNVSISIDSIIIIIIITLYLELVGKI